MKVTFFALFVALLMAGCGDEAKKPLDSIPEPHQSYIETQPNNPTTVAKIDEVKIETVNPVAAEPIDRHDILSVAAGGLTQGLKLQKRDKEGEELLYAPNQQTPFSGSAAWYYDNGKLSKVYQFKDGKKNGLQTKWWENGKKGSEENYKDGKLDGLEARWYDNGQKKMEASYKVGKIISAVVWKPNGEKCPESNVKDGNGVLVWYSVDETERGRFRFKDSEPVYD